MFADQNGARLNTLSFGDARVPDPESDHLRAWGREILVRSDADSAVQLFEGSFGVEAEPEAISVPTLRIHGSLDVISPVGNAESLASRIPNAETVVLEGARHVPTRRGRTWSWTSSRIRGIASMRDRRAPQVPSLTGRTGGR